MRLPMLAALVLVASLSGCANGPTHDYYNPTVINGPKFQGPTIITLVDDVEYEKTKLVSEGCTLIGTTAYVGTYPKASELKAQANRVHANRVIYSAKYIKGSWSYRYGGFGSNGADGGQVDTKIVFMGK